ncbi:glycerol-3-phosphate acyltransferase [Chloroflexota bacterium]
MWPEVVLVLGSYLLGAFPLLYLLGRLRGVDLRQEEDMHISLWRKVGRVEGALGIGGDFAKGVIVVAVARAVGFDILWIAVAGVAVVVGQMWTVFNRFDGEKGNSIGLAMAGTLATIPLFIALVPIAAGAFIRTIPRLVKPTESVRQKLVFGGPPSLSLPLGVAIGFAVLPLIAWGLGYATEIIFAFVALFVLIMVRRVTAGVREELRQASNKKAVLLNRFLFDRGQI